MKGFGIFVAVALGCAVTVGVVGTVLWQQYGPTLQAKLKALGSDAIEFAREHSQDDCVPEAMERLEQCDGGIACQTELGIFTRICLRKAEYSPDLCEDVPESLMQSILWPQTVCAEQDIPNDPCVQIFGELTRACQRRSDDG